MQLLQLQAPVAQPHLFTWDRAGLGVRLLGLDSQWVMELLTTATSLEEKLSEG